MKRRDFIASLVAAAATQVSVAEEPTKTYRVAIVNPATPAAQLVETASISLRALLGELRRLGYVEGRNLIIGRYSAEGRIERYPEVCLEVVRRNPDVVIAYANSLVRKCAEATSTIPILASMTDPVGEGLVASLARPGGNISGIVTDAGIEVMGKYLEILRELVPSASKFAYLGPAFRWEIERPTLLEAAQRIGVSLVGVPVDSPFRDPELRQAFAILAQEQVGALMVGYAAQFAPSARLIVELAAKNRLPAIYPYKWYMAEGGLVAYAIEYENLFAHMAHQVDQIFKGEKPADIPIQQATTFRLIINLKTAKALGITFPPTILARADQVIE